MTGLDEEWSRHRQWCQSTPSHECKEPGSDSQVYSSHPEIADYLHLCPCIAQIVPLHRSDSHDAGVTLSSADFSTHRECIASAHEACEWVWDESVSYVTNGS